MGRLRNCGKRPATPALQLGGGVLTWPCLSPGLLWPQLSPQSPCLAGPRTQDCCGPGLVTLSAHGSGSAPVLVETLTPPALFMGTGRGSSLWLWTGNILHDTAELLGGPGGGEPDHRCLGELPSGLGPEDEAVLGSAGLGADSRNRTQVRGEGPQCCSYPHLTRWGDERYCIFDGTRHKHNNCPWRSYGTDRVVIKMRRGGRTDMNHHLPVVAESQQLRPIMDKSRSRHTRRSKHII